MSLVAITPKFLADDGNAIFFFETGGKTYTAVVVPWSIYKIDLTDSGGKITGTINYFQDRSRWVESLKYAARNRKSEDSLRPESQDELRRSLQAPMDQHPRDFRSRRRMSLAFSIEWRR